MGINEKSNRENARRKRKKRETSTLQPLQQAGTTLSAKKTAIGFWERKVNYDWAITKTPASQDITIGAEGFTDVNFSITATRSSTEMTSIGVRGEITVTNGGEIPTENLKIVDFVEYKTGAGQFQPLQGASVTIIPQQQLASGETRVFSYEIPFTPIAGAIYRNAARVTITNHSGQLGKEFGPEPKADFSLPSQPTLIETDAQAEIKDDVSCPIGFNCTSTSINGTLTDSIAIPFTVRVTNVSAPCETSHVLVNTVTLTESDSGTPHTASALVNITTQDCPDFCPLSPGYWSTHPAEWPVNSMELGNKSYTKSELLSILRAPAVGDASLILGRQLIAAKLNIAMGADISPVSQVIITANNLLAISPNKIPQGIRTNTSTGQQMVAAAKILDQYNNSMLSDGCTPE